MNLEIARALLTERRIGEALEAFDAAERNGVEANECRSGRWMCHMLRGEADRAWRESALIAASGAPDPHRFWDGGPFSGKRVILRCLHGLGDAIQFIRYAPLIRREAARLIIESAPELCGLLATVDGVDRAVSWDEGKRVEWDQQVEVNELPLIFQAGVCPIPARVPYLNVPRGAPRANGPLRVGLIWGSSSFNPLRSIALTELMAALEDLQFSLYSFQRGPDTGQAEHYPEIHPLPEGDLFETAARMTGMDLVISVDTMTAHLAGALALPVWVLLPFEGDWRWMLDRSDSPWYPTMRLFRQKTPGDWSPVIEAVRNAALAL